MILRKSIIFIIFVVNVFLFSSVTHIIANSYFEDNNVYNFISNVNRNIPNNELDLYRLLDGSILSKDQKIDYSISGEVFNLSEATGLLNPIKEVILVIDISGSMELDIDGNTTSDDSAKRITIVKNAAKRFINKIKEENKNMDIGIVAYDNKARDIGNIFYSIDDEDEYNQLISVIDNLGTFNGSTNTGDGLRKAYWQFKNSDNTESSKYMILLTDGNPTYFTKNFSVDNSDLIVTDDFMFGSDIVQASYDSKVLVQSFSGGENYAIMVANNLANYGVKSHIIGFANGANSDILENIAIAAGSGSLEDESFFYANSEVEIDTIYETISQNIIKELYFKDVIYEEVFPEGVQIVQSSLPNGFSIDSGNPQKLIGSISNMTLDKVSDNTYQVKPYNFSVYVKFLDIGEFNFEGNNSPDAKLSYIDPFDNYKSTYVLTEETVITNPVNIGEGKISRQLWSNITDLQNSSNYPGYPDISDEINRLEIAGLHDNYGQRVRGYIYPPETGNYNFYIAGDDSAHLYLSANESPYSKNIITYTNDYTSYREWSKYSTQKSSNIFLEKNKKYYIEILHKEKNGGDHFSVAWSGPNMSLEIVDGMFLSTYTDIYDPLAPSNLTASNIIQTSIDLSWDEALDDTGVKFYHIYRDGIMITTVSDDKYKDENLERSTTYTYEIISEDYSGKKSNPSSPLSVSTNDLTLGSGEISYEVWTNVEGNYLEDMHNSSKYPRVPSIIGSLNSFDSIYNSYNYGQRIKGYLHPMKTGNYTFYIAGDDSCELNLSTDESIDNIQRIAYSNYWTSKYEWWKYPSQKSASVFLEYGKRYYIEAFQKQGEGGNHVSVAWKSEDFSLQIIDGIYLSPADVDEIYVDNVDIQQNNINMIKGETISLNHSVTPTNANIKTVIWSSTNNSIATVNSEGVVTAHANGTVRIWANSHRDKKKSDYCDIIIDSDIERVEILYDGVVVSGNSLSNTVKMEGVDFKKLEARVYPTDTLNKNVIWETVDSYDGEWNLSYYGNDNTMDVYVTNNTGIDKIVVKSQKDESIIAECYIEMNYIPIEQIIVRDTEGNLIADSSEVDDDIDLVLSSSTELVFTVLPFNSTFSTINIEKVNPLEEKLLINGFILKPKNDGVIKLEAIDLVGNEVSVKFDVEVKIIPIEQISIYNENMSIIKGNEFSIYGRITPENATDIGFKWEIFNEQDQLVNLGEVLDNEQNTLIYDELKYRVTNSNVVGKYRVELSTEDGSLIDIRELEIYQPVTGVDIPASEIVLEETMTRYIEYNIYPFDATNPVVYFIVGFEDEDEDHVISLNGETGQIVALQEGQVTITVTTLDGSFTEEVIVTVTKYINVESVEIDDNNIELDYGETHKLNVSLLPSNATNPGVEWSSTDTSVATVSGDGLVTPIKPGIATIIAKSIENNSLLDTCEVTVNEVINDVTLGYFETTTLSPSVSSDSIIWLSSDPSVATVDEDGNVVPIGPGETIITAIDHITGGYLGEWKLFVQEPLIDLNIDDYKVILIGQNVQIGSEIKPSTDHTITWTSSDNNIVTVDQNGRITGISEDIATIRATSNLDPSIYAECYVKVVDSYSETFELNIVSDIVEDNIENYEIESDIGGKKDIIIKLSVPIYLQEEKYSEYNNYKIGWRQVDHERNIVQNMGFLILDDNGESNINVRDADNNLIPEIAINMSVLSILPGEKHIEFYLINVNEGIEEINEVYSIIRLKAISIPDIT